MKKVWIALVGLSLGLIYFHQLEVEKKNSPFITKVKMENPQLIDTISLSKKQKENLNKYLFSSKNLQIP